MEIQRAYEILSKIQSKRMKMNTRDRWKEEDYDQMGRKKRMKDEF